MDYVYLLILFIGGIIGGSYGSMVGGGALVTLPLLILIGLPTHFALGTQRLGAVILELASSVKFYTAKKLDIKLAIAIGLVTAIGAIIGVTTAISINEKLLNSIVAVMLVVVAFILFNKDRLGVKERTITHKQLLLLFICALPLGVYGGFFGPGFGVFASIFLVFFGFSFIESAAIGRVIGFFTSAASALVFAQHGFIHYQYGLALGAGFVIGSWVGIGIALKRGDNYIKGLILLVILLSVIKLISDFL